MRAVIVRPGVRVGVRARDRMVVAVVADGGPTTVYLTSKSKRSGRWGEGVENTSAADHWVQSRRKSTVEGRWGRIDRNGNDDAVLSFRDLDSVGRMIREENFPSHCTVSSDASCVSDINDGTTAAIKEGIEDAGID